MNWSDVVIFVLSMAGIACGLRLVQRLVPHHRREGQNEVAGFIFAGVGVLYAVLLGFVVISVWGNVGAAQQNTFSEADSLAGVYWISRSMPLPVGAEIEKDTLAYANTVENSEWSLMVDHKSSPAATDLVYQIRSLVYGYQPVTAQQQVLYEHAVTDVENLASARRERLNEVSDSVPAILWVALIAGAVLTVGFTFLFGLSNSVAHGLMVLSLGALVVVSLILIKEMDYPFAGVTRVDPTAFQVFLSRLPPPR